MLKIQTGDDHLHLAAPSHVQASPAGTLTSALAGEIGTAYQIITSGPKTLQGQEATIAAAGAEVGYYTKTGALASATALPEAGYAHRIGGERKYDTTWKVYTAQPDNPAWQAYHLKQLRALPSWAADVFSDTALLTYTQGGKPAKPPGFTINYTLAEWLALEKKNLDSWAAATGKRFLVNGLSRDSLAVLTPGVGMIENAFASQKATLPNLLTWLSAMQLLRDAQAAGWTPWVYIKLFSQPSTVWDAWRSLIVPSMFIADAGSLLFHLGGAEGNPPIWQTLEHRHTAYHPEIGRPVDPPFQQDATGAWFRRYDQGVVIANPTTTGVSIQPYTDCSPVAVAPQTGMILRRTAALEPVA